MIAARKAGKLPEMFFTKDGKSDVKAFISGFFDEEG